MYAKFFKAATLSGSQWSDFTDDFLFATDRVVQYEYTKRFTRPGNFSMVLPFDEGVLNKLEINGTIFYDGDWLWVQGISYDSKTITLTGTDAKGLLGTRISLYSDPQVSGGQGYDIATGTTQACIQHYVENNGKVGTCLAGRELPITAFSGADGLGDDSYMARLEYLSDIVAALCENAGIGYEMEGKLESAGFQLTTVQGVDRSFSNSADPPVPVVIFSPKRRNVRSIAFEYGVDNLYNVVYGVDSKEHVGVAYRDTSGDVQLARRECTVSVSEVAFNNDLFAKYALHQVEDNLATQSCTVEAAVSSGYGTAYQLGDIVSVQDIYTDNMMSYQITEVTKSYAAGQQNITLVFGTPKQKPLQKIVNGFLSGTLKRR